MAIIRNDDARALMRDAVVLDLGDLQRQADALRKRAEAEAQKIIDDARAKAEEINSAAGERGLAEGRERGYAEGFEQGQHQGVQQALAEAAGRFEQLQSAWIEALQAFMGAREQIVSDSQNEALRFAIALAERLTYRVVEVDPSVVQDQVVSCIQLVAGATSLRIAVHPDDASLLAEVMPQIESLLDQNAQVHLDADASIEPGGCVLQTQRGGEIDARIGTQIERIVEQLLPGTESVESTPNHGNQAAG